jgi:hypothetical protein
MTAALPAHQNEGAQMKALDFVAAMFNANAAGQTRGTIIIAEKLQRGFRHYACENITEASSKATRIGAASGDAYFAPAQFKDFDRTATKGNRVGTKAIGAWSFWLDIDVGDKKAAEGKGYTTQRAALMALRDFCDATGLPKPLLVVCSGYGLHVYWLMSEFVPADRWRQIASKLKALTIAHKFLVDQSRTADIVSLLRPAGTLNFKNPGNPQPVAVLFPPDGTPPKRCDLAAFEAALDAAAQALHEATAGALDGLDDMPCNVLPLDSPPPPSTPEEIERVRAMLAAIPPRVGRAEWRDVVWSVRATGWDCAKQLALEWSELGGDKWDENDFAGVWSAKPPSGRKPIGFGSLEFIARRYGYKPPSGMGGAFNGQIIGPGSAAPGQLATLADFNGRFFVAPLGGGTFIFDRTSENLIAGGMTAAAFKLLFLNIYDNRSDPQDDKCAPLAKKWLGWPQRTTYDRIVFDPSGEAREGEYNSWRGLTITPSAGDCSLIARHIRDVLCGGNERVYTYLIGWLALLVQRPWEKPGVALVMKSREGAGKSIIAQMLLDIFGLHGFTTSSKDAVAGRFNAHLYDKVLIVLEEAFFAGDPTAVATAKMLITNDSVSYEAKGKDATIGENFAHVMFLTNHSWAVPASEDARRFMVLDVSDERIGDHAYFTALAGTCQRQ